MQAIKHWWKKEEPPLVFEEIVSKAKLLIPNLEKQYDLGNEASAKFTFSESFHCRYCKAIVSVRDNFKYLIDHMGVCSPSMVISAEIRDKFQTEEEIVSVRTGTKNIILGKIDHFLPTQKLAIILYSNEDRRKIIEMVLMMKPFYSDFRFIVFVIDEIKQHIMNVTETICKFYDIKIVRDMDALEAEMKSWFERNVVKITSQIQKN